MTGIGLRRFDQPGGPWRKVACDSAESARARGCRHNTGLSKTFGGELHRRGRSSLGENRALHWPATSLGKCLTGHSSRFRSAFQQADPQRERRGHSFYLNTLDTHGARTVSTTPASVSGARSESMLKVVQVEEVEIRRMSLSRVSWLHQALSHKPLGKEEAPRVRGRVGLDFPTRSLV